ncbi:MAG TPA: ABC transporter ATP-binding protein [Desulfobacterales bacterium]|nr:ABC transporter ATP-binding protein [Desulfobacterales bacterium]
MHDVPAGHPLPPRGLPLFQIRDLAFAYPDGTQALRGVDLTIHHADRIALVGHNGSGKTTLVKHLNGLLHPQHGAVLYKGEPVSGDNADQLRQEVGILFQDPDDQLFCNTVYEDVAFGPMNQGLPQPLVDERVQEALRAVDLADHAYKPPHNLSYGQRKRAAFAAVLAMNPLVLVLDEPTANLDPRQVRQFAKLLERFPGTLVCITHDILFLQGLCDRAVVLVQGRVHHDYAFADLVAHPASLREHGLDFSFRLSCCGNDHHHANPEPRPQPAPGSGVTGRGGVPSPAEAASSRTGIRPGNSAEGGTEKKKTLIELRRCSYAYPDGTRALREVSLAVRRGDRLALIGENGAGKSTLAGVLLGTLAADGEILFAGQQLDARARRRLWRKVGIVFQDAADQLFCPTCWEEVAFGPQRLGLDRQEVDKRVREALATVQLSGYEQRVPLNMSGGERKRLAIAAVLAMQPELLILDEPTAGLDPRGEELLLAILGNLPLTMILITHDLFFINALTERTVVMHRGRILRDYRTDDFLADDHLEEAIGLGYVYRNECRRPAVSAR